MDNTNIKVYKDNSTKELIISIGPTDSTIEQLIVQFLSKACAINIEEINSLKEDRIYIEQESDISYAKNIEEGKEPVSLQDNTFTQTDGQSSATKENKEKEKQKNTEEKIPAAQETSNEFIMKSGKYEGMTPLQALREKGAFVSFMQFCQKNKDNKECTSLKYYVSALLTYIQETNVKEMSEDVLKNEIVLFRSICPNVVQHYEASCDFSNEEVLRTVVNKCYYSAYKFLSTI